MGGYLKVEYGKPDPKKLAIELAECMTGTANARHAAGVLHQHASMERRKVIDLQHVLLQLKERGRNPPAKVSRMDPLSEYDPVMIRAEIAEAETRADQCTKEANECVETARNNELRAREINDEIRALQESDV